MKSASDEFMSRRDTAEEGALKPENDQRNLHNQKAERTKTEENRTGYTRRVGQLQNINQTMTPS